MRCSLLTLQWQPQVTHQNQVAPCHNQINLHQIAQAEQSDAACSLSLSLTQLCCPATAATIMRRNHVANCHTQINVDQTAGAEQSDAACGLSLSLTLCFVALQ